MTKQIAPIVAMFIVGGLEAYAISQGLNGALLAGATAVVAGLGGYTLKTSKKSEKTNDKP